MIRFLKAAALLVDIIALSLLTINMCRRPLYSGHAANLRGHSWSQGVILKPRFVIIHYFTDCSLHAIIINLLTLTRKHKLLTMLFKITLKVFDIQNALLLVK